MVRQCCTFADLAWCRTGSQDNDYRRCGRLCGLGEADHRQSVVRIVSDAVVGESVTDTIAGAADGVRELARPEEAVSSVSGAVTGIDNKLEQRNVELCDRPPVTEGS